MNTPIAIKIECAKGEIMNAMQQIQDKYALPPCIHKCNYAGDRGRT